MFSYLSGDRYRAVEEARSRELLAACRSYVIPGLKPLGRSPRREYSRFHWAIVRHSPLRLSEFSPRTCCEHRWRNVAVMPRRNISLGGPSRTSLRTPCEDLKTL